MTISNYNPDVLSCLANLSSDEVFTPPAIVNQMLDLLPAEIWRDPKVTFLDPACKTGVFLREIAKRLLVGLEKAIPDRQKRINHIFTRQLFGIAITEITALLSRRSVYCSKTANGKYSVVEWFGDAQGNIRFRRIEHTWENGRCRWCGASQCEYDRGPDLETHAYEFIHTDKPEEVFKMQFDVIIGNPPYQLSDSGHGVSAGPLFHFFVQQAKKMQPTYLLMIIPARWYAGGKGLDEFRDEMLNDRRMKILVDYESSKDCFEGVNIAGGICYFLWEKNYNGDCEVINMRPTQQVKARRALNQFPIFIRANQAISIVNKVLAITIDTWDKHNYPRNPFGFSTKERGKPEPFEGSITLLSSRGFGYVSMDKVTKNANLIDKYKVIIGRLVPSNGELDVNPADGYRVITNTKILKPGEIHTESYLLIGAFDTLEEALNFDSFIKLKFPRFLLRQAISSVNVTKECFRFVPSEDFTQKWTDENLYKKYGLNRDEIDFVESTIRPMTNGEENDA
ncbi:MAG TPA: Eco57I restriction-modification methylase domain-containing protein [Thermodesulfobacteriota bacterium]|nr:Eco57I restriction-modification methylase domain-containing protein [Thermodesulfobacteriota bacterium]